MANPDNNEQSGHHDKPDWQREHYNVQRLIAIGGLLGLVVLSLQWCEMRKSTDAATKAAIAARDGITRAEATAHLDQRAWVSTVQTPISGRPQVGSKFSIRIPVKNNGKTFARNLAMDAF